MMSLWLECRLGLPDPYKRKLCMCEHGMCVCAWYVHVCMVCVSMVWVQD